MTGIGRPLRRTVARRRFAGVCGAAAASAVFIASRARAAQYQFKCGGDLPVDHPTSVNTRQMWAAIERESGGRIHTEFFPDNQLGSDPAMFSQLRVGALQFISVSPGTVSSVVPVANMFYVGFAFKDAEEAYRTMEGPLGAYIGREMTAKGVHALSVWDLGMFEIGLNPRPIRTPEDMRGLKLRVVDSRIVVDLFRALGASPVPLSPNEMYTALQTKVIDGEMLSLVTIEARRFYEVNKYISLTNHLWSTAWLVANGDTWNGLPPDLQAIVDRNSKKYAQIARRQIKILNVSIVDKLARQGVTINPVDPGPFLPLLKSYYQSWESAFGPAAWGMLEAAIGRKLT